MRIDGLVGGIFSREDCLSDSECPDYDGCSSCTSDQTCVEINRTCLECAQYKCVDNSSGSSSSSSGKVSKGALAGAIVGSLVFLCAIVAIGWWWRRRLRLREAARAAEVKEVPASAADVLSRPDPTEKPPSRPPTELNTVRVYSSSQTTIDLDPASTHNDSSHTEARPLASSLHPSVINPFDDTNSIQTAGTEGTNVIPIALVVPPESHISNGSRLSNEQDFPVRPVRSEDLNLNLEHVNVSRDTLPTGRGDYSVRSGVSDFSSRNSVGSYASYSSEFLREAPVIVTPTRGTVRQVVGVVKAEVVNAPGSADSLKVPLTKPTASSPLASTSFGPSDILTEEDESQECETSNPFSDGNSSVNATAASSPHSPTSATFGRSPISAVWPKRASGVPRGTSDNASRPSSVSTQAGSIIDIGSAKRVNVGLASPSYRRTMGKLISSSDVTSLEDQQKWAYSEASTIRAARRSSGASTSTHADSILESYPFVTQSPISNRPARTPPVSPNQASSFSTLKRMTDSRSGAVSSPVSVGEEDAEEVGIPTEVNELEHEVSTSDAPMVPPDRRMLGMSTGSSLSTASSGLGSFPFQIESGEGPYAAPAGRTRASLDTLAITADLNSYPLPFERDSSVLPPVPTAKR
ncbi:hypothetical protein FISHEDRAFT_79047 [Fistulina hepatica ATCC 64428]|uniref:Membrane anchor Opy2 N-terminal domain-containing protein n=1 Tax=Fistulina hepatica ATCC 64428 TaxID=1128425 RepID=A0A0D6ZZH8_9AGAR|nr:hypothetical protein FISHEDRAFT_79047 [Fistulina hepatica ATCC 64428]